MGDQHDSSSSTANMVCNEDSSNSGMSSIFREAMQEVEDEANAPAVQEVEAAAEAIAPADCSKDDKVMSSIFREAMIEVEAEASKPAEESDTISFMHAPEILGHRVHVSTTKENGISFFANEMASELWSVPAPVPTDMSMDPPTKSELWTEPAIPPSCLEDETSVGLSWLAKYRDETASSFTTNQNATKLNIRTPLTPTLHTSERSMTESMQLTLSPIPRMEEDRGWDPE